MIGRAHHTKTIVVPLIVGVIVVASAAPQILWIIVPRTATERARLLGSSPLDKRQVRVKSK